MDVKEAFKMVLIPGYATYKLVPMVLDATGLLKIGELKKKEEELQKVKDELEKSKNNKSIASTKFTTKKRTRIRKEKESK